MAKATPVAVGLKKGLQLKRKFLRFYASDEAEEIIVDYIEWLETDVGEKVDEFRKSYRIKDRPVIEDFPATERYTFWDTQLGGFIRNAINETLVDVIPVDSKQIEEI